MAFVLWVALFPLSLSSSESESPFRSESEFSFKSEGEFSFETAQAVQSSGLSVFDTRNDELYIPTLALDGQLLDIRLRLDSGNIMTLLDSNNTERRTAVAALFNPASGIAHIPYAAIYSDGELEQERYSLKLRLIEEIPQIRLQILELELLELSVVTVTGYAGGRVGVLARGAQGESIAVMGGATKESATEVSAGAIYTTPAGDSISVFVDEVGRPLLIVGEEVILRFSDYSGSNVTLTLMHPDGRESALVVQFDRAQMDALLSDFSASVSTAGDTLQVQAFGGTGQAPVPASTSRMLSYGANLLTYATCLAADSHALATVPDIRDRTLDTCTSSTLAAARVQGDDARVTAGSISCASNRISICAPVVQEFEDRLTRANRVVAAAQGNSGNRNPGPINPVWREIPNTRLADVAFDWSSQGNMPGATGVYAYSGAAFDTRRNRLLIHGGGHGDYGGQEIYAFDINTSTWSMVAAPERLANLKESACTSPNQENYGRRTTNNMPKSVHTYDRLVYVEQLDALLDSRASVAFRECRGSNREAALWDFGANKWQWWSDEKIHADDAPYPTPYSFGGVGAAAAVHPVTKEIWFVAQQDNARLTRWNPSTGAWSQGRADNHVNSTYNKVAVIDSARNNLIIGRARSNSSSMVFHIVPLDDFREGQTRPQDYVVSTTGDNQFLSENGGSRVTMDYDPVSDQLVAWAGHSDIYTLNLDTLVWTRHSVPGAAPGSASTAGTYGRFRYVASIDKFLLTRSTSENVLLLDLRSGSTSPSQPGPTTPGTPPGPAPSGPTPPGPTPPGASGSVTTFALTSATSNPRQPFTTAVAFAEGDVSTTPTLNLENYQVEVKKRWHDGSVKHAVFSGSYDARAGQPATVTVYASGQVPRGTNLTPADIAAAAPSASVQLGSLGTVSLSNLLGSPSRVWLQGPNMIEAHYVATVGRNPVLTVKFQVRLYAGGAMRVRAIVENGRITDVDTAGDPTDLHYVPRVTIAGQLVYDNSGAALHHHHHTRWSAEGWLNVTDPRTTVKHDTAYLTATRLVPNYWKPAPSSILNEYDVAYTPMGEASWRRTMGNPGWSDQIGILPSWDAAYLTSGGDPRAYRAVETNAKALNSHGIIWADPNTHDPIALSDWERWTVRGEGGGGANAIKTGPYSWSISHHGSGGYFAYLITGDYYYLETMQHQTATNYLITWSARGRGTQRRILSTQTRSGAWAIRTIGQTVAISPDSRVATDFSEWLRLGVVADMAGILDTPGLNQSGFIYTDCAAGGEAMCYSRRGFGGVGAFQQNFLVQSMGYISHLKPLADMSDLVRVRDHLYKIPVGLTGTSGADQYCFTRAGAYLLQVSPIRDAKRNPEKWFDSWGDIYEATWEEPSTQCGNTLQHSGQGGGSVSEASTGFWGNFLPALSYAVEDGAPGAAEGWQRIQNAANFSVFENSGFDARPMYGIVPRGTPD